MDRTRLSKAVEVAGQVAPGISQFRHYSRQKFQADLVSSVTVVALLVPSALALAQLAGLQPVAGLYTAMAAMVAYALFASSRHVIVGPESGVTLLVAVSVTSAASLTDAEEVAETAAMLALLAGAIMIAAAILRLGFIAEFLSKPLLVGYINGAALTVIASQLGKIFGVPIASTRFFQQLQELISELGDLHWPTLVTGISVIAGLFACRAISRRIPAALIAVAVTTTLSWIFDFASHGIAVVGAIPSGLPGADIPRLSLDDTLVLLPAALGIALLSFSDSVLTGRAFASRHSYSIDPNRELIAAGAADVAAGVFQGFPISASSSRTSVNEASGGQTQAVGLIAAIVVGLFLLFFTGLLEDLPLVTLGAIIIVASYGLIDVGTIRTLWHIDRVEALVAIGTTIGVLVIGVLGGILAAAVLALIYVIWLLARPHIAVLGQDREVDGYHEIAPDANPQTAPGVMVFRFDAPMFFANSTYFLERTRELIVAQDPPLRVLIMDMQGVVSIDSTAMEALTSLLDELDEAGTRFIVVRARRAVRGPMARAGLAERIGEENFFQSLRLAVNVAVRDSGGK